MGRSRIAAAHAQDVNSGRYLGQQVKAVKLVSQSVRLVSEGHSYRSIDVNQADDIDVRI